MLQMAAIGVAVGNACPQARDASDFIMKERNDEGGAGLAKYIVASNMEIIGVCHETREIIRVCLTKLVLHKIMA
jgi:hypothetical protein